MTEPVLTNTPRAGETPEQIAARTAPRGLYQQSLPGLAFPAKLFYLTEPSRGVFIVNFRIGTELQRMEISRDQLANFLVDGAAMALRTSEKQEIKQDLSQPISAEETRR